MKNLSEVTRDDAVAIISAYFNIGAPHLWKLEDRSEELDEPCRTISRRSKVWLFWFNEDDITVDIPSLPPLRTEWDIAGAHKVPLPCFIKAHQLGYHVPGLSEHMKE